MAKHPALQSLTPLDYEVGVDVSGIERGKTSNALLLELKEFHEITTKCLTQCLA